MKNLKILIVVGFLLILNLISFICSSDIIKNSANQIEDISDYIINEMQNKHIPGLSAAIVIEDKIVWKNAYGYANISKDQLVVNETLFKIASVSKTITASCLMQLYEQEYFDLDDSINDYLPFNVKHPFFPSVDISFHMLLTHSSGINDNWEYMFNFVGDSPISFQIFLQEYLVPGGLYYDEDDNFCSWEPGTNWRYSNIGVALIGYLVEIISGYNFTEYTETFLFNPLDMNESGWYLADLDESHIAMPYHWNGNGYEAYGHIGWVDVPAGDLRTSSSQLINFLTMFINNGTFDSQHILNNETVNLMLTPQLIFNQNLGLIWWKSSIGGRTVWGHGGSDYGARAQMHFYPEKKIGVVVLINGEANILQIVSKLFDFAETYVTNSPPASPIITGPTSGETGKSYTYSLVSVDPDGDDVFYEIDWGDGNVDPWDGPHESNTVITRDHEWSDKGDFTIRARAKDTTGAIGDWGEFEVTMPRGKLQLFNTRLQRLLERFPNLFSILRLLLY